MAQTATAISFKDCSVGLSTGGTTFTDVSGFACEVKVSGGDRQTGEAFTFDGDIPILRAGKRGSLSVEITAVYTEGSTDPFDVYRALYESGAAVYARYSPKGLATGTGEFVFTTDAGYVVKNPYPQGKADGGDPVKFMLSIKTPQVTKTTSTT